MSEQKGQPPSETAEAVLKSSSKSYCANLSRVKGCTFEDKDGNPQLDLDELLNSFNTTGFQATQLGEAVRIVNRMLHERKQPFTPDATIRDEFIRPRTGCTIFLAYTSNMISSGLRENIRFLVKNKLVDCIVTTAGGIEEDIIKCLRAHEPEVIAAAERYNHHFANTYVGSFKLNGSELREKGINRIGNLLMPNDNYCLFESWLLPKLDQMLLEQNESKLTRLWSPSKMIERLAQELDDPDSICYWAAKNKIPIFCPAITDGSLDIRRINDLAHNTHSRKTGAIILGGGVAKHHVMNANLMRNGADYTVYINTGNEFDGSDSGAEPDEAVSWGKLRPEAMSVKVTADATIAFPLLVASTFYKHVRENK